MRGRIVVTIAIVICVGAAAGLYAAFHSETASTRIVLYGDSLSMQSAQDFEYLATVAGAPVLLGAYNGWAVCDVLPRINSDMASWSPTVAVLEFSGNAFTPCMGSYQIGTVPYYAKYRADMQRAIDLLVRHHVRVVLVGVPLDAWPSLTANVVFLNTMYKELASSNHGVTYVDAGQSVMADGRFTWRLACLPREPCAGPSGTNLVRSPDGVHFCPTGVTHVDGPYDLCSVYSSGAYRFATAMLDPALGRPGRWPGRPDRTSGVAQAVLSASRARSSGLTTLPVGLRGNSSMKNHWRGTL